MTEEELLEAVRGGDTETVGDALREDPGLVGARGPHGLTPLHVAAEADRVEVASVLLDAGADPTALTDWGATPLEWAANLGSGRVAALLLERGSPGHNLWTAAALGLEEDVLEWFDDDGEPREGAGRAPRSGPAARGWPPDSALQRGEAVSDAFYAACRNGHTEVAAILLERGADVDAKGFFGATGLHWAAINGHAHTVGWLLENGADPTLRDDRFQSTPAGWAKEGGHAALAEALRHHVE